MSDESKQGKAHRNFSEKEIDDDLNEIDIRQDYFAQVTDTNSQQHPIQNPSLPEKLIKKEIQKFWKQIGNNFGENIDDDNLNCTQKSDDYNKNYFHGSSNTSIEDADAKPASKRDRRISSSMIENRVEELIIGIGDLKRNGRSILEGKEKITEKDHKENWNFNTFLSMNQMPTTKYLERDDNEGLCIKTRTSNKNVIENLLECKPQVKFIAGLKANVDHNFKKLSSNASLQPQPDSSFNFSVNLEIMNLVRESGFGKKIKFNSDYTQGQVGLASKHMSIKSEDGNFSSITQQIFPNLLSIYRLITAYSFRNKPLEPLRIINETEDYVFLRPLKHYDLVPEISVRKEDIFFQKLSEKSLIGVQNMADLDVVNELAILKNFERLKTKQVEVVYLSDIFIHLTTPQRISISSCFEFYEWLIISNRELKKEHSFQPTSSVDNYGHMQNSIRKGIIINHLNSNLIKIKKCLNIVPVIYIRNLDYRVKRSADNEFQFQAANAALKSCTSARLSDKLQELLSYLDFPFILTVKVFDFEAKSKIEYRDSSPHTTYVNLLIKFFPILTPDTINDLGKDFILQDKKAHVTKEEVKKILELISINTHFKGNSRQKSNMITIATETIEQNLFIILITLYLLRENGCLNAFKPLFYLIMLAITLRNFERYSGSKDFELEFGKCFSCQSLRILYSNLSVLLFFQTLIRLISSNYCFAESENFEASMLKLQKNELIHLKLVLNSKRHPSLTKVSELLFEETCQQEINATGKSIISSYFEERLVLLCANLETNDCRQDFSIISRLEAAFKVCMISEIAKLPRPEQKPEILEYFRLEYLNSTNFDLRRRRIKQVWKLELLEMEYYFSFNLFNQSVERLSDESLIPLKFTIYNRVVDYIEQAKTKQANVIMTLREFIDKYYFLLDPQVNDFNGSESSREYLADFLDKLQNAENEKIPFYIDSQSIQMHFKTFLLITDVYKSILGQAVLVIQRNYKAFLVASKLKALRNACKCIQRCYRIYSLARIKMLDYKACYNYLGRRLNDSSLSKFFQAINKSLEYSSEVAKSLNKLLRRYKEENRKLKSLPAIQQTDVLKSRSGTKCVEFRSESFNITKSSRYLIGLSKNSSLKKLNKNATQSINFSKGKNSKSLINLNCTASAVSSLSNVNSLANNNCSLPKNRAVLYSQMQLLSAIQTENSRSTNLQDMLTKYKQQFDELSSIAENQNIKLKLIDRVLKSRPDIAEELRKLGIKPN